MGLDLKRSCTLSAAASRLLFNTAMPVPRNTLDGGRSEGDFGATGAAEPHRNSSTGSSDSAGIFQASSHHAQYGLPVRRTKKCMKDQLRPGRPDARSPNPKSGVPGGAEYR